MYSLLSSEWKGDSIVFLGDDTPITTKEKNLVLKKLSSERQAWGEAGTDADYVTDKYTCISGLFKASEKEVRNEIAYITDNDFEYNIYGLKRENPYEGLFTRESKFCRYTINHSKKEFLILKIQG